MIQISSDVPNLNLSFFDMIKANRLTEELPNLVDLGSCGLHTVHNAFKHGYGWMAVKKILNVTAQDL